MNIMHIWDKIKKLVFEWAGIILFLLIAYPIILAFFNIAETSPENILALILFSFAVPLLFPLFKDMQKGKSLHIYRENITDFIQAGTFLLIGFLSYTASKVPINEGNDTFSMIHNTIVPIISSISFFIGAISFAIAIKGFYSIYAKFIPQKK